MIALFFIVGAYLAGSIPTGFLITKILKKTDIRKQGSGNPGATNVFRVAGPLAGAVTLAIDMLKGYAPTMFAINYFGQEKLALWIVIGLAALIGHMWTIFLGFRGGKGVATGAGVFIALLPLPTLLAIAVFVVVFAFTRYISASSILSAVSLPAFAWLFKNPPMLCYFASAIGLLVIIKHHANIKRLIAGKELRVVYSKKEKEEM